MRVESIKGYIWMVRKFGVRRTLRYEHYRRKGYLFNYHDALTPEEMAVMEEHFENVPWGGIKIAKSTGSRKGDRVSRRRRNVG